MEVSLDLMEQKVHELDARLKQMKEERDQVLAENEELQEQLDMTNTSASVGIQKINELRNEVQKLGEEVTRIDYSCTTQEHELKTLSDHMCDLNSLKETVKEHNEEIVIIKDDYTRMKTHLNVSAKLELQTQERVYESRLHHLENVLEEMRQREGHFLHLAEETAVLKDQVDALRELSVMVLKDENIQRSASFPPSAVILESPVRSHSNISFKSETDNLEKEILANAAATAITMQEELSKSMLVQQQQATVENSKEEPLDETKSDTQSTTSATPEKNEKIQLMNVSSASSPKSGIKVSGTLKLMKPFEVQQYKLMESEDLSGGCFPRVLALVWSTIFD